MKKLLLTIAWISGFIFSYQVYAIETQTVLPAEGTIWMAPQMTVNDFIEVDLKSFRTSEGKKIKWAQRLALNMAQKNLAKKVKKGKIDGDMSMQEAARGAGGNIHGLLSLIFSVVGLFIPLIGLLLIIAAFVLGIIGIKKDNNPTMAIIGLVVSGLVLFLILILIAVGVSLLWAN